MTGWDPNPGWGSGGSSSTGGSGWGQSTSGWGQSIEEPTDSENDKALTTIGGMDKEIEEDEMIGALEDIGISESENVTQDQFSEFLGRLGFDENDAESITDSVFAKDSEFTGADMLATIGDYAGDDDVLDKDELESHNTDLAKLGGKSGGWGS